MPGILDHDETCQRCGQLIPTGQPVTWRRRGGTGYLHPSCVTRARGHAGRIRRVGVELEGGWATLPVGWHSDGSVGPVSREDSAYSWAEYATGPGGIPPHDVPQWIRDHYPDRTNARCGLHVHVSFRNVREYAALMTRGEELSAAIIRNLTDWGTRANIARTSPFWPRLRGENSYCADQHPRVNDQAAARSKGHVRYAVANFCWSLHGTLEIRVLHAFRSKELAVAAVKVVLDTIEAELSTAVTDARGVWPFARLTWDGRVSTWSARLTARGIIAEAKDKTSGRPTYRGTLTRYPATPDHVRTRLSSLD